MAVHALHVSGRKEQNPGFQVFPPEKIEAARAFFSLLGFL
jgi:hypothetical protein